MVFFTLHVELQTMLLLRYICLVMQLAMLFLHHVFNSLLVALVPRFLMIKAMMGQLQTYGPVE